MKAIKSLVEMKEGEEGTIVGVQGGRGLNQRLGAMCIRQGVKVRKVSGPFLRGPVIVQIGNARAALGYGMAAKVILEVDNKTCQ